MGKLTERQNSQLKRLSELREGVAWCVSGHNRIACAKLVELGLAIDVGGDGLLSRAYRITEAGRLALSQDPKVQS